MSCNEVIRLLYTVKILIEETEKKIAFIIVSISIFLTENTS